ncbi:uncharacterized protein J3D65DRAFT_679330 [Phyllosticta citribraziliensis]|uniref:Uncharacterized protein n=1 Tax=Phyllosticta citribraziliensis TaxID=989973 RepID=A0ABR1LC44_9PEZI
MFDITKHLGSAKYFHGPANCAPFPELMEDGVSRTIHLDFAPSSALTSFRVPLRSSRQSEVLGVGQAEELRIGSEVVFVFAASPDHGILHAPVFPRLGPEAGSHADGLHAARRPSKRPKALDGSIHDSHNTSKPQPKSLKLDSTVAGPSMALIRGEGQSAGRKRKASSEPEDPEKRSRNDADLPGSEQTPGPKEKPKILNFKLGPVAHGYRPAPSFTFSSPADLDPIKAAPQRRNMLVVDVDALGDSIKLQRQLREKDGVGLLWTDAGGSLHAAPLLPLPS